MGFPNRKQVANACGTHDMPNETLGSELRNSFGSERLVLRSGLIGHLPPSWKTNSLSIGKQGNPFQLESNSTLNTPKYDKGS